jgi:hypothetical protein
MARKSRVSRKSHRGSRKTKRTMRRRTYKKRGGSDLPIRGAPVNYSLAGDWSSRMSLGQGDDFFKYHEGQHGGEAPFPGGVTDSLLPVALRGPAHIAGIDKAIADVRPLRDENQVGGRRKRRHHTKRKSHKKHRGAKKYTGGKKHTGKKSHRKSRRHMRKRGGALGYAPVSAPGMLLSGPRAYAEAGLNPEWKTAVEFTDAKIRNTQ